MDAEKVMAKVAVALETCTNSKQSMQTAEAKYLDLEKNS